MTQTAWILDASSFQHRAFHVAKERPTYDKSGVPNYAVNLFRKMIACVRKEHHPNYMVAALDCKEPTFRTVLYPQYKAQRLSPHPEYNAQIPGFRSVLREFLIPTFEKPGFEADDIIGTLAHHIECDVVIASGDKDMAQLVERSGRVKVYNTGKNKLLDSAGIVEEYGVVPSKITDYLALVGDTSDNVPGCKGIGPDGALLLLSMFDSVEELVNRVSEISSNRYRQAVAAHRDEIILSKRLVTIDCAVPNVITSFNV